MSRIEEDDDVKVLQGHIKFLDRELEKQKRQNLISFMCAALSSTPGNYTDQLAADRAYGIALRCVERLK